MLTKREESMLEKLSNELIYDRENLLENIRSYQIEVPGFSDVWLFDQSGNPTGTHKDWLALEITEIFRGLLEAKKNGFQVEIPEAYSMISSGNAAFAIQRMFSKYQIPSLRVIVDERTKPEIIDNLRSIGCKVYLVNLTKNVLEPKDILKITENPNGKDISNRIGFIIFERVPYLHGRSGTSERHTISTASPYKQLIIEIFNKNPDFVFVPYGSGLLYWNILDYNRNTINENDFIRFLHGEAIRTYNFIAATTGNPNTKADKLYAPQRSSLDLNLLKLVIKDQKSFYHLCGPLTGVRKFNEKYLKRAEEIISRQNKNKQFMQNHQD